MNNITPLTYKTLQFLTLLSITTTPVHIANAKTNAPHTSIASKKHLKKKKSKKKTPKSITIPPAPPFFRYTSYTSLSTALSTLGALTATLGIGFEHWSLLFTRLEKNSYQAEVLTFLIAPLLLALPISWYQYTQQDSQCKKHLNWLSYSWPIITAICLGVLPIYNRHYLPLPTHETLQIACLYLGYPLLLASLLAFPLTYLDPYQRPTWYKEVYLTEIKGINSH